MLDETCAQCSGHKDRSTIGILLVFALFESGVFFKGLALAQNTSPKKKSWAEAFHEIRFTHNIHHDKKY